MRQTLSPDRPRSGMRAALATGVGLVAAASVALLASTSASAAPARGGHETLEQPDGSTVKVQLWGDEWLHGYETASGYTLLQGKQGWWKYAVEGRDGSLVASDARAGVDQAPAAASKHLRDQGAVAEADAQRVNGYTLENGVAGLESPGLVERSEAKYKGIAGKGSQKTLVILVEFKNQKHVDTKASDWASRYFGKGNSVNTYYDETSAGQFKFRAAQEKHGKKDDGVVGWLKLDMNHPNTAITGDGNKDRKIVIEAIKKANKFVDYKRFDSNKDGYLTNEELHISVIPAGYEGSYGAIPAGGKAVWGHRWSLANWEKADGVRLGYSYTMFGEMHNDHQATIGIIAHELGHDLGLPDLYDTGGGAGEGVGEWSLMGSGSWNTIPGKQPGAVPVLMDAWSRWSEGWINPQNVNGTKTIELRAADSALPGKAAVRLLDNPGGADWPWNQNSKGQYFLVENRQKTPGSYDEGLNGSGLLIWHIDESQWYNTGAGSRIVDLEEADGLNQLDAGANRGDAGDPYPGTSGNTAFTGATNPNSNKYNGSASGVSITGISAPGLKMTATFAVQ